MGPAISFHNHVFAVICVLFLIRQQSTSRANSAASALQNNANLLKFGEEGGVNE